MKYKYNVIMTLVFPIHNPDLSNSHNDKSINYTL